jgi:hypothetical protein
MFPQNFHEPGNTGLFRHFPAAKVCGEAVMLAASAPAKTISDRAQPQEPGLKAANWPMLGQLRQVEGIGGFGDLAANSAKLAKLKKAALERRLRAWTGRDTRAARQTLLRPFESL